MSTERVVALARLLTTDETLRDELAAQLRGKNIDEAAEIGAAFAKRHGYDATPEEVTEVYTAFVETGSLPGGGELSDAELEAVAGGPGGSKGGSVSSVKNPGPGVNSGSWEDWLFGIVGAAPSKKTGGPGETG